MVQYPSGNCKTSKKKLLCIALIMFIYCDHSQIGLI